MSDTAKLTPNNDDITRISSLDKTSAESAESAETDELDSNGEDYEVVSEAMIATARSLDGVRRWEPTKDSPEALALQKLEKDFERRVVVINENKTVETFKLALDADGTAGHRWEDAKDILCADGGKVLKKAMKLQGGGRLIGFYPNGDIAIVDGGIEGVGIEPVIFIVDSEGKVLHTVTKDMPNRAQLMQDARKQKEGMQFANYWEIRKETDNAGFHLALGAPPPQKKGLVAAAEAVTGAFYSVSGDKNLLIESILECGDVSETSCVRVVYFDPKDQATGIRNGNPSSREAVRGAVRWLRGKKA